MLYQAKLLRSTQLYPLPDGKQPVIATLDQGLIVDVAYVLPNINWTLISTPTRAGWVPSASVKRLPVILVDLYHGDFDGKPDIAKIIAAPGFHGIILKATQGTSYNLSWLIKYWALVKSLAGSRFGVTWFRGAYHYLEFFKDGKAQADYYLAAVKKAGGFDEHDLLPIVDAENGSDTAQNRKATAQQVIDVVTAFAERVEAQTGRPVMGYWGSAIRDRKITSHMGCKSLWVARYSATLPSKTYTGIGWPMARMWQYTGGDKTPTPAGCPPIIPGVGACDLSVLLGQTFAELTQPL